MRSKYSQNKNGVVSIYALVLMSLFLTMGLTMLGIQLASFQDTKNMSDAIEAQLLAQSALQEARYYVMNIDSNFSGASPEQPVGIGTKNIGTYKYTVNKSGNIYDVTAIGYVPNSTARKKLSETLTLRFRYPNPLVIFGDNFESNNLNAWGGESNDSGTDWDANNTAPNSGTFHGRSRRTAGGGGTKIARLLTPTYNLSFYDTVVFRFSYRKYNGGTRFRVYQNTTASPTTGWVLIFSDTSNTWSSRYIRPAVRLTISPLTPTVRFRFEAHMGSSGQSWFLDDCQLVTPYAVYNASLDSN